MDTFDVPLSAANAVLYTSLVFFTLIGIGAGGFLSFLPHRLTKCCLLSSRQADGTTKEMNVLTTDFFLSARNSANAMEIGLSYFASGMGAWVSS